MPGLKPRPTSVCRTNLVGQGFLRPEALASKVACPGIITTRPLRDPAQAQRDDALEQRS